MDTTVELTSGCIEGKNTATERLAEMEHLEQARQKKLRHVTTNCKVLGEGINVPTLDAIAILEEKSSEIDIIQAVGRVLRKPATGDKNHGYLIVPVVIESQKELFEENLAQWSTEWRILGKVLRALRAHDPEINTDFHKRVLVTSLKKIEGGGRNFGLACLHRQTPTRRFRRPTHGYPPAVRYPTGRSGNGGRNSSYGQASRQSVA